MLFRIINTYYVQCTCSPDTSLRHFINVIKIIINILYILDINYISLNSVAHPRRAIVHRMPYDVRIYTHTYAYNTHIPRTPPTHARTHVLYLRICTLERINARLQALEARGDYGRVIQRSIGLEERWLKEIGS